MAAGHKHAVRALQKRFHNEERIDTSGAGHTDNTQISRLIGSRHTRSIGAAIGTPVAEEAYNPQLLVFQDWHKALTSARIWLSVEWESCTAPCGQVATHKPHP